MALTIHRATPDPDAHVDRIGDVHRAIRPTVQALPSERLSQAMAAPGGGPTRPAAGPDGG